MINIVPILKELNGLVREAEKNIKEGWDANVKIGNQKEGRGGAPYSE